MLSVIIVDYNSINDTLLYIKHLQERLIDTSPIHFVIVDNYEYYNSISFLESKLGEYDELKNESSYKIYFFNKKKILYIHSNKNLGYAKGNNLGIEFANRIFKDDFYLVSNNDILINESIHLERIYSIFNNDNKIGVIGPKIIGLNGHPQSPHKKVSAFDYMIKQYWSMATHNLIKWNNDLDYDGTSKYCYRVMGSFMFIKYSIFEKVGMFDPKTFMFAEEMILGEKLLFNGYKTFFINDIEVIHNHGKTVNRNFANIIPLRWSFDSTLYYYLKYRNMNKVLELIAKINFEIYVFLYMFKHFLKNKYINYHL